MTTPAGFTFSSRAAPNRLSSCCGAHRKRLPLVAVNHLEGHALSPRLADPALGLVPPATESASRWGVVRVHGEAQELWWYGTPNVSWQRNGRQLQGAQAVLPGDRLMLGGAVIEWDQGQKPGLAG